MTDLSCNLDCKCSERVWFVVAIGMIKNDYVDDGDGANHLCMGCRNPTNNGSLLLQKRSSPFISFIYLAEQHAN